MLAFHNEHIASCAFLTYFSPESSATPATSPTTGAQATLHNDKQSIAGAFLGPKTINKDKGTYDTAFHTLSIEVSTPEGCLNSDEQKSRKEKLQNDAYFGKLKSNAKWEGAAAHAALQRL
ncbi:GD12649 [Drosophila simulans]|uniref:GD12649 n=1 Tax=Drosophila simulans TaxID=7240 RepID=B4QJG8_DROSI|nr:GD12649 [Drosophila simulans]